MTMYLNMSEDSILMSYLKRYDIIVAVSFVERSKFSFKTLYDFDFNEAIVNDYGHFYHWKFAKCCQNFM